MHEDKRLKQLYCLILAAASLGGFKTTSYNSSGWICFHWSGGFIICAKPCKRQFRCDRNAVKDKDIWSNAKECAPVPRCERDVSLQECARVCLIAMSMLFIRMLDGRTDYYSHHFTAEMHNQSEYCSVGSCWVSFSLLKSHNFCLHRPVESSWLQGTNRRNSITQNENTLTSSSPLKQQTFSFF